MVRSKHIVIGILVFVSTGTRVNVCAVSTITAYVQLVHELYASEMDAAAGLYSGL